jgi:hypothetical protein
MIRPNHAMHLASTMTSAESRKVESISKGKFKQ